MTILKFVLVLILFAPDGSVSNTKLVAHESLESCTTAQERVAKAAKEQDVEAFTACVEVTHPPKDDNPKLKKERDS